MAGAGSTITPKRLMHNIRERLGIRYHITSVRRIMHRMGLTTKTVRRVHVNRAGTGKIREWQRDIKRRILRLERDEFTVVVFDETLFTNDPKRGAKYWSPEEEPVVTAYNGRHEKVVAYGAIATDGRQFFRTYDKFYKDTVLEYLKEMYWHWKDGSDHGQSLAEQVRNSHGVLGRQQGYGGGMASHRDAGGQRNRGVLAPGKARHAGVRVLRHRGADAPRDVRILQDGAPRA